LSVEYCWWGRRNVFETLSIEMATGLAGGKAAVCVEVGASVVAVVDKGT
jgi:hypothetical protein